MKNNENDVISETNQKTGVETKILDVDTILSKEIGQFGWHQFRTTFIVLIFIMLGGIKNDAALTTARIETRCYIPGCEKDIESAQFRPDWLSAAVPRLENGKYDNCHRFAVIANDTDMCQFNHSKIEPCQSYVYENHNTIVYDFDLACDEWFRTFITALQSTAFFIALPLSGYISDRWGRRVAFTLNLFCVSVFGMSRYWSYTMTSYLILGFISSIFVAGYYPSGYILVMEAVGPKHRVLFGTLASSSLSIGHLLTGAAAWLVPQWRELTLLIYSPTLIVILFWFWFPDSPRWLLSKKRFKEAEKVIQDMARMNNTEVSEGVINTLKKAAEEEIKKKAQEKKELKNEPWLPVLVFRNKPLLIRCIVAPVWWFTFVLIYYSLGYNSVYLSGNPYVSIIAVYAIDIPGFIISLFLINKIGRKPVLSAAYFLCAASQIAYIFVPRDNYEITLTIYLIGKLCAAVVVQAVYIYTAELFPTKYRHRLFAFSSMMGRVGNLIAPFTPAFADILPPILYASFALLSGFLVFLTPETLGCKLPDTIEEACNMKSALKRPVDKVAT